MPKADRLGRPSKKRKKEKHDVNKGYGSRYRELYFNQNRKCGLTGTAMDETDDIYIKDNEDLLALEASVIADQGDTTGWTSVDVSEPEKVESLVEDYDHYEAWNPTIS